MPSVHAQAACSHEIKTPLSLLPLYSMAQVDRLENENRLDILCPTGARACRSAALAPSHEKIDVYAEPQAEKLIGSLTITYTPGAGMAAVMKQDSQEVPYTPTVFDADWGYGPWFHATLLETRKGWYRIALPLVGAGWIRLPDADVVAMAQDKERVYSVGKREVMILGLEGSEVILREAQPADMWCADGEAPPLQDVTQARLDISSLYNDACEVILRPAFLRGC